MVNHKVSKSSHRFPSNLCGSFIFIGFANSNSLILLSSWHVLRPRGSPWSDNGGSGPGRGAHPVPPAPPDPPAPPASSFLALPASFPLSELWSLPSPPLILPSHVKALFVHLKLEINAPQRKYSCLCGWIYSECRGYPRLKLLRKLDDSETL